jgi:hypothetical protein
MDQQLMQPRLSIIIVNYGSAGLILDCLHSIARFQDISPFEIIVIDNEGDKEGGDRVQAAFSQVQWHQMGYNAGYARANNQGMRLATGDAFLLLNPDTVALDDSIIRCYQMLSNSSYGAAGVQLLHADGSTQISGSYFVKGGLNHLLPIPYWGDLIRWFAYRAHAKIPGVQQASGVQDVDWINGAFLMVKRSLVHEAGMLDEDFFLYAEEIEWCARLRKNGPLAIFGDLKMIHLEGATINKSQNIDERGYYNIYDRKGLQLMVSNHLRVRKQYGMGWFLFLLFNYTWGVAFYFLCSTLSRAFRFRNPAGSWSRIGDFGLNVIRLWKLAPTIIANKPHFYKMF